MPQWTNGFWSAPGCVSAVPFANWFQFIQLSRLHSHSRNARILTLIDVQQHLAQQRAQCCCIQNCTLLTRAEKSRTSGQWSVHLCSILRGASCDPSTSFSLPPFVTICCVIIIFILKWWGLIHHHNIPALKPVGLGGVLWYLSVCHKW